MRILFLSDIHGVPSALEAALAAADALGYDRIALLGDLLYHGPRNGVPNLYDPVRVAKILNSLKDRIVAVRGNCDAEVDQMMVEFPIMADYAVLDAGTEKFFLTHGHLWNEATKNWGYGGIEDTKTREGLEKTYLGLMDQVADLASKGLGGSVYTQTTDVEIEINGLLTYDRKVLKYNPAVLKAAHEKITSRVK